MTPGQTLLMPVYRSMDLGTVECLLRLSACGEPWQISFLGGSAVLDRARSVLLSKWYKTSPHDVALMVDADIGFSPEQALQVCNLARAKRGIAHAAYPVRGGTRLALSPLTREQAIRFAADAPPLEIAHAGTGFLAVHRDVVRALTERLHEVDVGDDRAWPFFHQILDDQHQWGEDYSFCMRARQAGFQVWLDPSIQLCHRSEVTLTVSNVAQHAARELAEVARA